MQGLTRPQLLEQLQRQERLLANKAFIAKLPDKGEKINKCYKKITDELAKIDKIEESCKLFAALNIQSGNTNIPNKTALENLEWSNRNTSKNNEYLDSDDDSEPENPINILASNTNPKKKLVVIMKEEKLITEEDLKEIDEFKTDENLKNKELQLDSHTEYVCTKGDKSMSTNKESFKPYKTLISNSRDPKLKCSYNSKHWEVTAATPPASIYDSVKKISIKDSLVLQDAQNQQLKKIQINHAREKLSATIGKNISGLPSSVFDKSQYREIYDNNSESEDSDKETSDQEVYDDEPKEGGVVFTITN